VSRSRSRALIVNAYSVDNRGDAAIVAGLINSLRAAGFTQIAVAPRGWRSQPERWLTLGADEVVPPVLNVHEAPAWARRMPSLQLVHVLVRSALALLAIRLRPRADPAARPYADCDVVVSAGGAYLGGRKLGTNLIKGLNIFIGRVAGKPVVVAPMTISPPSPAVARALRILLSGSTVFVRDEPSRRVAAALGLRVLQATDLAFRAPPVLEQLAGSTGTGTRRHDGPLILGWAPRGYRPDHATWAHAADLERRSLEAIVRLLDEERVSLCFIAQTTVDASDDDRHAVERLRTQLPARLLHRTQTLEAARDLDAALAAFATLDLLLASRLHAGLLALAVGVPSLVVGYEPKVAGVLSGLGLMRRVIPPDGSWSAAQIAAALMALTTEPELRVTEEARARALAGFEAFDTTLAILAQGGSAP
jgi:colanic acid/amylovoran biosynthesis protein